MIFRAAFLSLMLACVIYGVLWLAVATPFFKDKQRVRKILKHTLLAIVTGVMTVLAVTFIISVEHAI